MNKLEYSKEDIIEMQNDIDRLYQENKELKEEIEKYKTTIEIYQPYFKGIDLVKEIEKIQELEKSDSND